VAADEVLRRGGEGCFVAYIELIRDYSTGQIGGRRAAGDETEN